MDYTIRPKRGNARKAWDKFTKEMGFSPKLMYYTPKYDHDATLRGWICDYAPDDPLLKWVNYGGSSWYRFYASSEL